MSSLKGIKALVADIVVTFELASPVHLVFLNHLLSTSITGCISSINSKLIQMEISRSYLRIQAMAAWTWDSDCFLKLIFLILKLLNHAFKGCHAVVLLSGSELIELVTVLTFLLGHAAFQGMLIYLSLVVSLVAFTFNNPERTLLWMSKYLGIG
jgi:hypothetical protein